MFLSDKELNVEKWFPSNQVMKGWEIVLLKCGTGIDQLLTAETEYLETIRCKTG